MIVSLYVANLNIWLKLCFLRFSETAKLQRKGSAGVKTVTEPPQNHPEALFWHHLSLLKAGMLAYKKQKTKTHLFVPFAAALLIWLGLFACWVVRFFFFKSF